MFDYAMWKCLGGAMIESVPATAFAFYRTRSQQEVSMPMIVEEDPLYGLNDREVDPGHTGADRVGSWHNGVGQYATVAGGVAQVRDAQARYSATTWYARTPSGKFRSIAPLDPVYGEWNTY
jgi:hypothetical protein